MPRRRRHQPPTASPPPFWKTRAVTSPTNRQLIPSLIRAVPETKPRRHVSITVSALNQRARVTTRSAPHQSTKPATTSPLSLSSPWRFPFSNRSPRNVTAVCNCSNLFFASGSVLIKRRGGRDGKEANGQRKRRRLYWKEHYTSISFSLASPFPLLVLVLVSRA